MRRTYPQPIMSSGSFGPRRPIHLGVYNDASSATPSCCFVLLCILSGYAELGFGQARDSATIDQIMTTALSRCYSTVDGVKSIIFVPATNEEFAAVEALGQKAIVPLAIHLDSQTRDGFTEFFAVKFLMAISGPSTLGPLKRAFAQDQWEVTRAAALSGIFRASRAEAKPYVEAALGDRSQLVRRRARDLFSLCQGQIK